MSDPVSLSEINNDEEDLKIGNINILELDFRHYFITQVAPQKRTFKVADITRVVLGAPSGVREVLTDMVSKGILTCSKSQEGVTEYQFTEDGKILKKSVASLRPYSFYPASK